jgi:hypothetical protein
VESRRPPRSVVDDFASPPPAEQAQRIARDARVDAAVAEEVHELAHRPGVTRLVHHGAEDRGERRAQGAGDTSLGLAQQRRGASEEIGRHRVP